MESFLGYFFKGTWGDHFGLAAPPFIWVASVLLVLITFGFLVYFYRQVHREGKLHARVETSIRDLAKDHPLRPGEGLSLQAFDEVSRIFDQTPPLQGAWQHFLTVRILRRNAGGEDQVWMAESADKAFSEQAIVDARINRAFFSSIPGIITGFGLFCTFLAILVALLDVRLSGTKQVEGLDLLIKGLSGKFMSSIAALGAAILYLLLEKQFLYGLVLSRHKLTSSMNGFFPVLSSSQILADLSRDISEQSTAFRTFNADLSQKLKQSFSESMGPTLVRMVSVIEDLNQLLRAAEAQKQESITGSIESLLQKLEAAITGSLGEMTNRFTESISGGARAEFAGVIESLRGAAGILEKMNGQFVATQQMVTELTELSRRATTEQIETGRSQIEGLTEVLRGLMTQLNETAGISVSRMAATLTAVVHDLSSRMAEMSDKMTNTVIDSAGLATGAANEVIAKADQWSANSSQQLAKLLDTHHAHLETVKGLRDDLEMTMVGFRASLEEYSNVTSGLRELVANAGAAATSLGGIAKSLKDTHVSVERVVAMSATQVEHLSQANKAQDQTWQRIKSALEQYEQLFRRVETDASKLLQQITEHLAHYTATSRNGLEHVVKIADEHFANATKRLGSSVSDLDDVLQDLIEGLAKHNSRLGGAK